MIVWDADSRSLVTFALDPIAFEVYASKYFCLRLGLESLFDTPLPTPPDLIEIGYKKAFHDTFDD
jgi:hypothetical protein